MDSCPLPLTLGEGFKSVTLFKDMLKIFPEFASPEVNQSLKEGIPVTYLMHLITNPFDWDKIFEDLSDMFILFYNIVNEEATLTSGGRVTRRHSHAMARSVTAFGNRKVKRARKLALDISSQDLDYFLKVRLDRGLPSDLISFLDTHHNRIRYALRSLNLQKLTYRESGDMDWSVHILLLTCLTVNLKEETDTEYTTKERRLKSSWIRIRKLVALYYTAEQREALLAQAYGGEV